MVTVIGSRKEAGLFIRYGIAGFQFGNTVIFSSGIRSPGVYMDNRKWPSYPDGWNLMLSCMQVCISSGFSSVEGIAAVESAGIMHGAVLANRLDLPFFYVRKKAKGHGLKKQIEGDISLLQGKNILLVEDVATEGGSALDAVHELRCAGAVVQDAMFLAIYNFPQMIHAFCEEDVDVHTVTTFSQILDAAVNQSKASAHVVSKEHEKLIRRWLENPRAEWTWP